MYDKASNSSEHSLEHISHEASQVLKNSAYYTLIIRIKILFIYTLLQQIVNKVVLLLEFAIRNRTIQMNILCRSKAYH